MRTINLTISAANHGAVAQIKNLGVLRIDRWEASDGVAKITLHERTWGEWWGELWDPQKAVKARESAADALKDAFVMLDFHAQLTRNIHDLKAQSKEITGEVLARDFAAIADGKRPSPVRGGAIVADNKGRRVDFIQAPPQKILCDHAIVRAGSASRELGLALHEGKRDADLSEYFTNAQARTFTDPRSNATTTVSGTFHVGLAAADWTCVEDIQLPDTGGGEGQLSAQQLKTLFKGALEGKRGAVVIEPFPNVFSQRHGKVTRRYSEEGLQAQLEAAREATRAAEDDLVISFACEDEAVLKKLREMSLVAELSVPIAPA